MKKTLCWMLGSVAIIFVLGSIMRMAVSFTQSDVYSTEEKPYSVSLNVNAESLSYKLAATVFKPLIEAHIDKYLKDQGMEEYLKDLKDKVLPVSNFLFHEVDPGEGHEAVCGQKVSAIIISIPIATAANNSPTLKFLSEKALDSITVNSLRKTLSSVKDTSPITFVLGMHEKPEINYLLTGMKKHGSRVMTVNSGANAGSHYARLLSISSPMGEEPTPESLKSFIVFDRENADLKKSSRGSGITLARCGDRVSVKYSVRDISGKVIVEDQITEFTIGSREVPIALDLGAVDLRSDTLRSIIVPPSLMSGLVPNYEGPNKVSILDMHVATTLD